MNKKANSHLPKVLWMLFGSFCVALLAFGFLPPFNYVFFTSGNLNADLFSNYGEFIGGLFGTIAALLTAVFVVLTLKDQQRQFRYSSFESNFYSLLTNHREILNSISDNIEGYTGIETGADFFAVLADRICLDFEGETQNHDGVNVNPDCLPKTKDKGLTRLLEIYEHHYYVYQSDLSHYFRNLYNFFEFIIEADVDEEKKVRHIKILRAQLSNYEILLIAYNGLYPYGEPFKEIIDKYHLLKNLNFEISLPTPYYKRIVDPKILIDEYSHLQKAFEIQTDIAKKYNHNATSESDHQSTLNK